MNDVVLVVAFNGAGAFNEDISGWDVSTVTSLDGSKYSEKG